MDFDLNFLWHIMIGFYKGEWASSWYIVYLMYCFIGCAIVQWTAVPFFQKWEDDQEYRPWFQFMVGAMCGWMFVFTWPIASPLCFLLYCCPWRKVTAA
jgi:hypothetical protein